MNPASPHSPTVALGPSKERGQKMGNCIKEFSLSCCHICALIHWNFCGRYVFSYSILQLELGFSVLVCGWVGTLRVTKFCNKDDISAVLQWLRISLEWNVKSLSASYVIRHFPTSLISSFIFFFLASYIPATLVSLLLLLYAKHVPNFQLLHFIVLLSFFSWTVFLLGVHMACSYH